VEDGQQLASMKENLYTGQAKTWFYIQAIRSDELRYRQSGKYYNKELEL